MSLMFTRWRGRSPGLTKQDDRRRAGRNRRSLSLEMMEARTLLSTGTITPLMNNAPGGSGTMLLETNGQVLMVGGGVSNQYFTLSPDASGNYVDGKWSQVASSGLQRLYNGSVVLPSGQILVIGGEYSGPDGDGNETNEGEIYTPSTNTWAPIANFPLSTFGDDNLLALQNGTVLATFNGGPQSYIYTPSSNTWTQGPDKYYGDSSAEEGLVELPNGDFLDYCISATNYSATGKPGLAELYVPASGSTPAKWIPTQNLPAGLELSSIADPNYVPELGGGLLLPNGQVFWLGGNGETAYYNVAGNSWTAGPNIPDNLVCDDAPVAEASNGDLIFSADTALYTGPAHVFEYNPTTQVYADISSEFPSGYLDGPAYIDRELNLPNGQILFTNSSNQLVVYTPATPALAANIPTIKSISENANGSFALTGTGINGNSDGSDYGDDVQSATNYPIVSFTNTTGQVAYATTSGFNYKVEQAPGTQLTTQFTLPTGLPQGTYSVKVIANGAASAPFALTIPTKPNDLVSIKTAASATPNPVLTKSTQLSVLGADTAAAGESTLSYTWTTTAYPSGVPAPTFSVNGTNAAKSDTATFYAVGSYTFQVTATNLAGLSVSSSVSVKVNAALASLALSPTVLQLSPNESEQFNVSGGLDQFGNSITTASLSWTLTSGNGTLTQTGLYTAPAVGTIAVVTVSSGKVAQSATIYVLSNPFSQTDIGGPSLAGDAADNGSGLFTVIGAGTGITSNTDQFQFAYLSLTGNATIQAQIASVQNTNAAAEAGITFRSDSTAGSPNVTIAVTPTSGLVFSYRTVENGNTVSFSTPRVTAGEYVKLVRVGTIFTGYYSANGTIWTQANASVSIAMNATALAGMAATSASSSALNTSTFNHLLADSTPTIVTAASATPNPVTGTKTTLSVLGGDADGESALTYTWATTALPSGATAPTFATNGTNASKSDVVTFFKAGTYSFTVTLANALGYSTTSSVTVSVVATQTTVSLTPLSISVTEGTQVQFTAAVFDQFGFKLPKQPIFTYSMVAGGAGGKVSSTGLYTAPNRTGVDYLNVTGAGTASVAKIVVTSSIMLGVTKAGAPTSVTSASVGWGTDSAPLVTAADGLRLLPAGRTTDLPWSGIQSLTITLSQAQPIAPSEIKVTGVNGTNYGPVTITATSTTSYVLTLAQPITSADRVTVTLTGPGLTTYTRRLDVLPGDVNDDGVVNATDATIATGYLTSTYVYADVFGDGVVSGKSVKEIQLLNGTKMPVIG